MFAQIQNNQIVQLIPVDTTFTIDGITYPTNWIRLSTPEEKASLGIVDVVYQSEPSHKFYWVTPNEPVYNAETNQVDVSFSTTPKELVQLKETLINEVQNTAYTLLLPSDWMVVKAIETESAVASEWKTWRALIRTTAAERIAVIEQSTSVEELAALTSISWEKDPSVSV